MSEITPGLESAPKTVTAPDVKKVQKNPNIFTRIFRRGAQPKAESVSAETRRAELEQRKANILAFPDFRVGPEDNRLVDKINAELKGLEDQEGKKAA